MTSSWSMSTLHTPQHCTLHTDLFTIEIHILRSDCRMLSFWAFTWACHDKKTSWCQHWTETKEMNRIKCSVNYELTITTAPIIPLLLLPTECQANWIIISSDQPSTSRMRPRVRDRRLAEWASGRAARWARDWMSVSWLACYFAMPLHRNISMGPSFSVSI